MVIGKIANQLSSGVGGVDQPVRTSNRNPHTDFPEMVRHVAIAVLLHLHEKLGHVVRAIGEAYLSLGKRLIVFPTPCSVSFKQF